MVIRVRSPADPVYRDQRRGDENGPFIYLGRGHIDSHFFFFFRDERGGYPPTLPVCLVDNEEMVIAIIIIITEIHQFPSKRAFGGAF